MGSPRLSLDELFHLESIPRQQYRLMKMSRNPGLLLAEYCGTKAGPIITPSMVSLLLILRLSTGKFSHVLWASNFFLRAAFGSISKRSLGLNGTSEWWSSRDFSAADKDPKEPLFLFDVLAWASISVWCCCWKASNLTVDLTSLNTFALNLPMSFGNHLVLLSPSP